MPRNLWRPSSALLGFRSMEIGQLTMDPSALLCRYVEHSMKWWHQVLELVNVSRLSWLFLKPGQKENARQLAWRYLPLTATMAEIVLLSNESVAGWELQRSHILLRTSRGFIAIPEASPTADQNVLTYASPCFRVSTTSVTGRYSALVSPPR